jgi:hypothetical protein
VSRRVVCTGRIRVALAPHAAIELFTPEGERPWAGPDWDPSYPAGDDDTVFVTAAHGHETVWITAERSPLVRRYARVALGVDAGTVTVRCHPDGEATLAEVTYDLTALTPDGAARLRHFAAHYDAFLGEWERAIAGALGA